MANIIQQVELDHGQASFVLINEPLPDSIIVAMSPINAMNPVGVASRWVNTTSSDAGDAIVQVVIGYGPFTPNIDDEYRIQLTAGRTPPKVAAQVLEIAY